MGRIAYLPEKSAHTLNVSMQKSRKKRICLKANLKSFVMKNETYQMKKENNSKAISGESYELR